MSLKKADKIYRQMMDKEKNKEVKIKKMKEDRLIKEMEDYLHTYQKKKKDTTNV